MNTARNESIGRKPAAPTQNHGWLLWVAVASGLAGGFFFLLRPDTPLSPDAQEYVELAMNLADRGELRLSTGELAKRPPLYPLLLSLVYRWQRRDPVATQNLALLLQTLMWMATAILIALIAARIAGHRAGLIAGLLAALYSPFHELQMSFLSETLLVFLIVMAIWIYMRAVPNAPWGLLAVSAILGLAALVRPNAAAFLPAIMIDAHFRFRRATPRRKLGAIVSLLIPFAVCIAAWGIRNQRALGSFTLSTTSGLNFHLGHCAEYARDPGLGRADYSAFDRLRREQGLGELEADRKLFETGLAFARTHPGQTIINFARKTRVWLGANVAPSAPSLTLIVLAIIAAAAWPARRDSRLNGPTRAVHSVAIGLLVPMACLWTWTLLKTRQPWVSPLELVPFGLAGLLFARDRFGATRLLALIVASQWLVALVFIPLVRIRWTVDFALIVFVAVALARCYDWMRKRNRVVAAE